MDEDELLEKIRLIVREEVRNEIRAIIDEMKSQSDQLDALVQYWNERLDRRRLESEKVLSG